MNCEIPEHGLQFAIDRDGEDYRAKVYFGSDYRYFDGHFEIFPLVPGVCQVEIVERCAEAILGAKVEVKRLQRVKFKAPIRPDTTVEFKLSIKEGQVSWSARSGEQDFSEGAFAYDGA